MAIACPVCGDERDSRNNEFQTAESLAGHISASKGPHEGIGFRAARRLAENAAAGTGGSAEADTPPDSQADSNTGGPEASKEEPAAGLGLEGPPERSSSGDDWTCSECGGSDWFDVSGASNVPFDRACPECSTEDRLVA